MLIEAKNIVASPVVSVTVITYNHANFIEECLAHVLSQSFEQPYEIIIAEDCSTDGTREICQKYQQQYPDKIRLLLQDTNKGLIRNFGEMLKLCRGEYVAICSGDDYWCDNSKIKKQYDCLKNKKGYGFVRTLGYELHGDQLVETTGGHLDAEGDVRDIAIFGPLGFASSAFFEKSLLQYFDVGELCRRGITLEDYPMNAIFAHHTKFALIRERMVVYRILDVCVSRPQTLEKQMKYRIGYHEAKRYIMELYPEEVPWTEEDIQDAQNYARLKYNYQNFDYKNAKSLTFTTNHYKKRPLVKFKRIYPLFYIFSLVLRLRRI